MEETIALKFTILNFDIVFRNKKVILYVFIVYGIHQYLF